MALKLYVGGLAYSVTDKELEELFSEHGKVTSATVIKDRDTDRSKGFGFVEMSDDAEAKAAMAALNGKEVSGRSIMVNEARPKEDRSFGGGGGFRKSY
ncbi:MAG TPA: RNA-binding protein [Candidatus Saccharimonadales bacterium]